jgi:hypothetical protein
MNEYATPKGKTVKVGDTYRDANRAEPRTLRVTAIGDPWPDFKGKERCNVELDVLDADGAAIRAVDMEALRITGRDFLPIAEAQR